jgi:pyruvate ferredoxin oxidoreductase alpha subunit
LYNISGAPQIFSFHLGLGGRDVTPEAIIEAYEHTKSNDVQKEPVWIGLRK